MKFIYVVTGSKTDYYIEQTILSAYTLRLHNSHAEIELVTDKETSEYIYKSSSVITQYVDRIHVFDTPGCNNNMQRSRYLKTNLRQLISGDYLFIDSDTIICDDLSHIANQTADVCAVPDKHVPIGEHHMKFLIHQASEIASFSITDRSFYYNSGVMFVRDTPNAHKLYEHWYQNWVVTGKKGVYIDQPALAKADEQMGHIIHQLSGEYNCQINENGLKYLDRALIIHYFANYKSSADFPNPYKICDNEIFLFIKQNKYISDEIKAIIQNPRAAFIDVARIVNGVDAEFFNTRAYSMYRGHYNEFLFFEKLYNFRLELGKSLKKILKK